MISVDAQAALREMFGEYAVIEAERETPMVLRSDGRFCFDENGQLLPGWRPGLAGGWEIDFPKNMERLEWRVGFRVNTEHFQTGFVVVGFGGSLDAAVESARAHMNNDSLNGEWKGLLVAAALDTTGSENGSGGTQTRF